MQLNWVNPWRFLAFRLFSWFWLVLLLTIASAWLLAKAFLDDTVIRRLPPGVHEHAERMLHSVKRFDSVEDLLQRLNRRENNRWLLVDPLTQRILNAHILPRGFDQSWLTELSQFDKPRLFLHRHISLAGPFFVRLNGQPLVLYQQQPRPEKPGLFGLAQLPEFTIPALFLLVSALASIGLAFTITRPLRQLQQHSLQFASGDLSSRVQQAAKRSDEIGELARGFNTMASQIGALLQNQQRLLRDISHELRSPLTRAQLAIALEQRQGGGSQLPRLSQELDKIDSMLDELLTFSRLDAGQYQLQLHDIDLSELLEEIVEANQIEAAPREQQLVLKVPALCMAQVDSKLLARAVENVLRNAIKYSPVGSVIELALHAEADRLHICISDQGPGIPETALHAIFEPFYRVSDARTAGAGGTGLGLAIAAQAVKQHQGQIHAENIYQQNMICGLKICLQLPQLQEQVA
jgi:two-component system sensor histidine kinase CpxA